MCVGERGERCGRGGVRPLHVEAIRSRLSRVARGGGLSREARGGGLSREARGGGLSREARSGRLSRVARSCGRRVAIAWVRWLGSHWSWRASQHQLLA